VVGAHGGIGAERSGATWPVCAAAAARGQCGRLAQFVGDREAQKILIFSRWCFSRNIYPRSFVPRVGVRLTRGRGRIFRKCF
jgi:hypothetical protein